MSIAHRSFFFLVAGSKTIVSIGQACLTVEATVLALNCLVKYHHDSTVEDGSIKALNVLAQITAATFSVAVIAITRYPAIWDKLKLEGLHKQRLALQAAVSESSHGIKASLLLIGLFGLLSCVSRGLSAYLGVEVLLGERIGVNQLIVSIVGWLAGVTVVIAAMCFNLSNMLTEAANFLKKPSVSFRPSIIVSMIAALSTAVAMRFFIMHFLMRRQANTSEQIIGQSVFAFSEFVLACFTMVSSFEANWQSRAKKILCHSFLLTFVLAGDSLTTWLGYNTITWYSILSDSFLGTDCGDQQSTTDFALRWTFMATACLIAIPTTLSYIHYLLDYTKQGYNRAIDLMPASCQQYRFRVFKPPSSRLHELREKEEMISMHPLNAY